MNTLNILIIDDELGMRIGMERVLKNHISKLIDLDEEISYKIETASTGEEGLKKLRTDHYDLLILDHKLPDLSGLDILGIVTKEMKDLLVIMATAFASLDVAISATRNGAFDFLAKPFAPEEIRDRIDKAAKHIVIQRRAMALEKEKKQIRFQFISVLAHELKSPLSAIEGYLQMMTEKIAGDDIASYQNMIERSMIRTNGMRKMILDLLDLTRIESGNTNRNLTPLNLAEFAQKAIDGVSNAALEKNISIKLNVLTQGLFLNADPIEMDIIFNNLLTNAVKYNKLGGEVSLTLSQEGQNIKLECSDTGIGLTQEETKKLFSEFVRIKNDKTRNIEGSGLGLSIVKKIIHMYKGQITVKSIPDSGTTFILMIPLVEN